MQTLSPIIEKIKDELPALHSVLYFDIFLLAILILATRTATLLHEFIGHVLMAVVFGGDINGVRISLFGGGHTYYHLKMETGLPARFLIGFGGIIVNLLSGLLPFFFVQRCDRRPALSLFLILFSMVSLLGAIGYCALGFYYNQGDPVAWSNTPSPSGGWLSLPFLIIAPFASYSVVRAYSLLNARFFSARSLAGRGIILLITLGITAGAYYGLYGLTGQRSTALDSPTAAYRKAEREVRLVKIMELFNRLRESSPELSEEEVRQLVKKTPVMVKPEEVPQKFPLKPVILFLYFAGAFFALRGVKDTGISSSIRINPKTVFLTVFLAMAGLCILAWTGGWIFR